MAFGQAHSRTWRKQVVKCVNGRSPSDPDFPWVQLQKITDSFLVKKGDISTTRKEQKLLRLIEMCDEKYMGISACGHVLPSHTLKALLDGELNTIKFETLTSYLYAIIAAHRTNPISTSKEGALCSSRLASFKPPFETAGYFNSHTLCRQFQYIVRLQAATAPTNELALENIVAFSRDVSVRFIFTMDRFVATGTWLLAYSMSFWLSNVLENDVSHVVDIRYWMKLFRPGEAGHVGSRTWGDYAYGMRHQSVTILQSEKYSLWRGHLLRAMET